MRRLFLCGVLLFVVGALFSACGKDEKRSIAEGLVDVPDEADDEEGALVYEEVPEVTVTMPRSRLTNEEIEAELLNRRPVSIMIPNETAALPQYGIARAGVVYECPMEGDLTRFLAVFDHYDGLSRIGNIRSCRPYFAYFAAEYDSIYVHYGQSVQGEQLLATGIVDDLNGVDGGVSSAVFYRSDDRPRPHNAYTSTDGILAGIAAKGYRTEVDVAHANGHFVFAEGENTLDEGEPVKAVQLYYRINRPYYLYDESAKVYVRYQFGGMSEVDGIDGAEVTCANLILQNVSSAVYEGYPYLNLGVIGSGTGKFLTRGRMIDITWVKDGDDTPTRYYDDLGHEIRLNTGKTWVHLIQQDRAADDQFFGTIEEWQGS